MEEHQRTRVLEAAIGVFADNTYPAASVDDLVNAARVGVGSFYSLVGGKEECLVAAYKMVVDEARAAAVTAAAPSPSWSAQVVAGLKGLLGWVQDEPARARIAFVEIRAGGPSAFRAYEETLESIADFLKQGRKSSDLPRPLPEALEQTTINGIAWLLHRRLTVGDVDSLDTLLGELGQLVLEPYLGEARAREALSAAPVAVSA
jgi:AcrR family transcriptional regulator